MSDIRAIKRALLSVSDKTGLIDFARALARAASPWSPPAARARRSPMPASPSSTSSDVTGFPEMMDGRVKTLHPKVHGGLLAIRENPEHEAAMLAHGIEPIDLLVVNLYPFEATVAKGADWDETIENIDIGGPAMIRAAAKNHDDVAVVVDVADYPTILAAHGRQWRRRPTSPCAKSSRKRPMRAPPPMMRRSPTGWRRRSARTTPEYRAVGGKLSEPMRYGENPHQKAGFYLTGENRPGVATARQLQGKQLSYNNVNDTDAAFELVVGIRSRAARRPSRSSSTPIPAASPKARP